jgi:hypothetical protein
MKHILALLVLLPSLLIAVAAQATDLKVSCVPSTKFDDLTTIPTSAVSTFSLYGGLAGQTKQKLVANATACAFTRSSVAPGVQEYYVTQTTNGVESIPSVTAAFTVTPPAPGAPTGVTVTVQITISTP